ncbi:MAG: TIGR03842 family LLM class F420-dependent oxidoreductase, partial [Rhodococcus sp.]|nr:TIGR03842 family LLM class F420-dependent oxidoreductase [Rhodococcus sp. (in: high G+C Gram-positive bacteria)]
HIAKLKELETLGVDQFSVYLQHDAKAATLEAYGESIIPQIRTSVTATS